MKLKKIHLIFNNNPVHFKWLYDGYKKSNDTKYKYIPQLITHYGKSARIWRCQTLLQVVLDGTSWDEGGCSNAPFASVNKSQVCWRPGAGGEWERQKLLMTLATSLQTPYEFKLCYCLYEAFLTQGLLLLSKFLALKTVARPSSLHLVCRWNVHWNSGFSYFTFFTPILFIL